MSNPKLEIYKFLKEKNLIMNENSEYEAMLKEEKHHNEFKNWHDSLPLKEQQDFDQIFN